MKRKYEVLLVSILKMKAVAFNKISPVLTGAVMLRLNTPARYLFVDDVFLTKKGGERGAGGCSESNKRER